MAELSAEDAIEVLKQRRTSLPRMLYHCNDGNYGIDYGGRLVSANTVRYMIAKEMVEPYWDVQPDLKAYRAKETA